MDTRDKELPAGLIRASLTIDDPGWLQNILLESLGIDDDDIHYAALLGLGHVARIHRCLDLAIVVPLVEKHLDDPKVGGTAEEALSDIEIFMLRNRKKKRHCRTPMS